MKDSAKSVVWTRFRDGAGRDLWEVIPSLDLPIPETDTLWGSAAYQPIEFDETQGTLHWVELNAEGLRQTPFLDHRALSHSQAAHSYQLPFEPTPTQALSALPLSWVFHVGHCGSTALSRLLGHHPEVLSLREPGFLWGFQRLRASQQWSTSLETQALRLLKRSLPPYQRVLIKPSSLQTELCLNLYQADESPGPFIALSSTLENYLLNALKSPPENPISGDYLSGSTEALRVWRRLGITNAFRRPDAVPELLYHATLSWLGVISLLGQFLETHPTLGPCLWIEHDEIMSEAQSVGRKALQHLGLDSPNWATIAPDSSKALGKSTKIFDSEAYKGRRRALKRTYASFIEATQSWTENIFAEEPKLGSWIKASPVTLFNDDEPVS